MIVWKVSNPRLQHEMALNLPMAVWEESNNGHQLERALDLPMFIWMSPILSPTLKWPWTFSMFFLETYNT
jgi:hypothetical protein